MTVFPFQMEEAEKRKKTFDIINTDSAIKHYLFDNQRINGWTIEEILEHAADGISLSWINKYVLFVKVV